MWRLKHVPTGLYYRPTYTLYVKGKRKLSRYSLSGVGFKTKVDAEMKRAQLRPFADWEPERCRKEDVLEWPVNMGFY